MPITRFFALLACALAVVSFGTTTAAQQLGPVATLATVAATPSGQPQLAVDAQGRVVLSWMEKIGEPSKYAFKYAFKDGDGWTAPHTIVTRDNFFVNWADVPSVFPMHDGAGLVAHWLQKNGDSTYAYDVRFSVSDANGRTWSEDRLPYTDKTQTEHGFASFFNWPGGGTGVVWLDGREMTPGHGGHDGGGSMTLRAARIGADGAVANETKIDARVCECCPTAAVATARGALVAYRDRSDTEVRDIAIMRLENGTWQGPTYVHADNWQINACPVNGPALAAAGDRVVLAWFTAEGDSPRVLAAFSSDGGKTFGKPVRIDDVSTLGRVDAVMLDDGRAVVSWLEFMPGASEFRARVVTADGARGPHFTITGSTADRQAGYPRMVRSGKELIFAWTSPRPTPQVKTAAVTLR